MKTLYKTHGTCSTNIEIEVEEGILKIFIFGEAVMAIYKEYPDW